MVILISQKNQDRIFAEALAKALKTECIAAPGDGARGFSEQIDLLQKNSHTPVVFDAESEELYNKIEAKLLKPELLVPRIHFLGMETFDRSRYVFKSPFFRGYIVRSSDERVLIQGAHLYSDLQTQTQDVSATLGAEKNFPIQSNLEKAKVLDRVREHFHSTDFGERNLGVLVMAADELLMNAIFDAPVDEMGNRISIATSRISPIYLHGRRRVELTVGANSSHVDIQVKDFFGSLEKVPLFEKVTQVSSSSTYKIDPKSAGAGLGLANVFRSGGSLLFHCKAGELTSVTALFSKTQTAQGLREAFRFILCDFN